MELSGFALAALVLSTLSLGVQIGRWLGRGER